MYYYTSAHGAAPERASLPGPMHRRHFATPRASRPVRWWCGPSLPQAREQPCPLFCHFLRVCACARGHGQQVCCQIGKVLWPCEATNWSRLSQCTVGVPINLFICHKDSLGYEKFVCLFTFKLWFFWRNHIGKVLWPCEATNWSRLSQCTVGVPINLLICHKGGWGYEKFVCLFTFRLWFF